MKKMTAKQIADRWNIPYLVGADNLEAWKQSFLALGTATIELDRIKEETKDMVSALLHYQNLADAYFRALNNIQEEIKEIDVQNYIDKAYEGLETI